MYKRVMEITTSVGCRNRCAYCPQDVNIKAYAKRSGHQNMTLADFKKCISKLPGDVKIFFAGSSEPWMNPECTAMVRYCYERGFKIRVYTTLVGMTKDDLSELSKMEFEKVIIHLPSATKREFFPVDKDYLSLVASSNELNIKNIEYMSVGDVRQEIKETIDIRIRETSYKSMSDFSGNLKGAMVPHNERKKGRIVCSGRNLNWNVLYPNGDVSLCCEDFGLKHILGNLIKMEYADLFKSKEFKKVADGLKDDNADILCRFCEYAKKFRIKDAAKELLQSFGVRKWA